MHRIPAMNGSKLLLDNSAGAHNVTVYCYDCAKGPMQMSDCIIDLNGPAFRAYYCRECAQTFDDDVVLYTTFAGRQESCKLSVDEALARRA